VPAHVFHRLHKKVAVVPSAYKPLCFLGNLVYTTRMKRFKTLSRKQKIIILLIVATLVMCGTWIFNSLQQKAPSRAEEILRPIDKALISAGAARKCETIAGGHHIASRGVGSTSYYEIKKPREEAKALVYKIAKENGFDLVQATPENRTDALGGIADMYLEDWSFDDKSKTSSYYDLEDGKIVLLAAFYNDRDDEANCSGSFESHGKVKGDDKQTVVRIGTTLPDLRREYRK